MLNKLFGKKIGMTQFFDESKNVQPVTVVSVAHWYVTQIKTAENDGYSSLQVGLLRKRYRDVSLKIEWLKNKKNFFSDICESRTLDVGNYKLGQKISIQDCNFEQGIKLAVTGISSGKGFQGVVKRWNFAGGPKSHGSTFHRAPGSIGNLRRQGEVIKGKKLPGHMGCKKTTVKGLKFIKYDENSECFFIKGAVPGKKGSLVSVCRQG